MISSGISSVANCSSSSSTPLGARDGTQSKISVPSAVTLTSTIQPFVKAVSSSKALRPVTPRLVLHRPPIRSPCALLRAHLNLRFHAIRRHLHRKIERLNAIPKFEGATDQRFHVDLT